MNEMISTSPIPSISLIEAFRGGTKLARQRVKGKEYRGNGVGLFLPLPPRLELVVRVSGEIPDGVVFIAATPTVAKLVV